MNILITGASGLLGWACCDILSKSHTICGLSFNKNKPIPKTQNYVYCDIKDKKHMEELFKNYSFDVIIHSAAFICINESCNDMIRDINHNATINLYNLALKNNVQKFIYISSVEALTNKLTHHIKMENLYETKQTTTYGKIKAETTLYLLNQYQTNKHMDINIIFPSGIIGTNDYSSLLGQKLKETYQNYLFPYIKGQFSFVDSKDIANTVKIIVENNYSHLQLITTIPEPIRMIDLFYKSHCEGERQQPSNIMTTKFILVPNIIMYIVNYLSKLIGYQIVEESSIEILQHTFDANVTKHSSAFHLFDIEQTIIDDTLQETISWFHSK